MPSSAIGCQPAEDLLELPEILADRLRVLDGRGVGGEVVEEATDGGQPLLGGEPSYRGEAALRRLDALLRHERLSPGRVEVEEVHQRPDAGGCGQSVQVLGVAQRLR